jgi:hypothetical protein
LAPAIQRKRPTAIPVKCRSRTIFWALLAGPQARP